MIDRLPSPGALTPRQCEAVMYRGGNLLIEAVPGSGKTRVMVARCTSLLAEGVPASRILLLTFSRRAAGELRARLTDELAGTALPDIRTFHGFAARLLADSGSAGRSRRLLSEPAEHALFEYIVTSTHLASLPPGIGTSPHFRKAASARVDEIRRASPSALVRLAQRATPRMTDLLTLDAAQKRLRDALGVADYDDLVARSVTLASKPASPVAIALNNRYAHVLVDEFQDTDPLQLALLGQFGGAVIFAVGDEAQAIYGFRGAARDALANARTTLSMATMPLDESFRCPALICDLARSVWPTAPPLHTKNNDPGDLAFRCCASPHDEAAYVGEAIADALAAGIPAREIAVLVRSAEPLLRLVEDALRARGITVARQGGENVLDDLAVDAICVTLKAFAEPADTECWARFFSHPAFGIAPLAVRRALSAAPPRSVDDACAIAQQIKAHARVPGARLANALRSAHACWDVDDPIRAARRFAVEADVLGFAIAGNENDAHRSNTRISSFLDGLADVRDVRAKLGSDTSSRAIFGAFLASSESWRAGATEIDDEPGVRVLTVHAAKGLEYRFVVIVDAVDDRFPQAWRNDALLTTQELETARDCGVGLGTRADEHIAEERSLWYVAVTRCKQQLLVTWSAAGLDGTPQRASRFIPLAARLAQAAQPPFRGPLEYAVATLPDPQPAIPVRLQHAIPTSSMETWFACRRKFYYSALLRIGGDERGFKAKLGTLVHGAIEAFHGAVRDFRAVQAGESKNWSLQLNGFARSVVASDTFVDFDSTLESAAALRAADRLLERYARELETSARATPDGFVVIASEERVTYTESGVPFSGKIDRIDAYPDGSLVLVDVKTSAFTKEKAMAVAFKKLATAAAAGELWRKATPPGNPQLALYRHPYSQTRTLAYVYLDARPKADEFRDAAIADRLDIATGADALAAIDEALTTTFFSPVTKGTVTRLEPTSNARTCRYCEFITVCPGYLEDDD